MSRVEELETYCMVVDEKSFSRAAKRLNLSQPAVSMQIKSLENEYQEKLLHRDGKEILPTEYGDIVYEYAVQIIELDKKSKQLIRQSRETGKGKISLASSSGPGEKIIPKILGKFKREYPDSEISLSVADSEQIINQVLKYQYQLGFVGTSRRDSMLEFSPFIRDELILVVSPNHKWAGRQEVDFTEVTDEPFILQQYGSGTTKNLIDLLNEMNFDIQDLNILMELGLQESTKTAVENGIGVTIISRLGILDELENGSLIEIPIKNINLERYLYIVHLKNEPLTNVAQLFLDYAKKNITDLVPSRLLI